MDDDIIFERKLTDEQKQAVADALVSEGSFSIEFSVVNDKIRYSHTASEVPMRHVADVIVEAVNNNWPIERVQYVPREVVSTELGAPKIRYTHLIRFDWVERQIKTSLSEKGGDMFFRVLAYMVETFRAPKARKAAEAN